jgi:hypothetical protein
MKSMTRDRGWRVGEIYFGVGGFMKELLRDAGSGLYVDSQAPWLAKPEGAAESATLEAAGRKAREFAREDVVVVPRSESPECEQALIPAYCATDTRGGGQRLRA